MRLRMSVIAALLILGTGCVERYSFEHVSEDASNPDMVEIIGGDVSLDAADISGDGVFPDACQPACEGRVCGPDSCGGVCGDCGEGYSCTPKGDGCEEDCDALCVGLDCGTAGLDDECNCGDCDDDNTCTDDYCGAGTCVYNPLDIPCDDGDPCTIGDQCQEGACVATDKDCDDLNPCTDDACDEAGSCAYTNNTMECNDEDPCTEPDICSEGECLGFPKDCEDENPCTKDSCSDAGVCDHDPVAMNGEPCYDGNPCTDDTCSGGGCVGTLKPLEDLEELDCLCAEDLDCEDLEDGDICNGTLVCTKVQPEDPEGVCVVDAATILSCEDDTDCTVDDCDPLSGCTFTPDDDFCDDDNLCTADACDPEDDCQHDFSADPTPCDDLNPCTDDACVEEIGCQNAFNTLPCDDLDVCTEGDACAEGVCVGLGEKDCVDDDLCTDDLCDAVEGCQNPFNTVPCDDEDVCTENDVCAEGTCAGPDAKDCDDPVACTVDTCDPLSGCSHVTDDDLCADQGECQDGVCDLTQGCSLLDVDDYTPCSEGICLGGTCEPIPCSEVPISCGDEVSGDTSQPPDGGPAMSLIDDYPCTPGSGWNETGPELAYRLIPVVDGAMSVVLTPGGGSDLDLFVLEDGCGAQDCTLKSSPPYWYGDDTVTFDGAAGTTYYIVVDGADVDAGTFSLTLACEPVAGLTCAEVKACVGGCGPDNQGCVEECGGAGSVEGMQLFGAFIQCIEGVCGTPPQAGCPPGAEADECLDEATACETGCAPSCVGKDCGDDGCGGSCGECSDGWSCNDAGLCTVPGAQGVTWVAIPGGAYWMGCSPGDNTCGDTEKEPHEVTMPPFDITATEITQAQYLGAMDVNPSDNSDCDNCPAENMLWGAALNACVALGGRLPSEAEWEYAARSGVTTPFLSGTTSDGLDAYAWTAFNASSTHPVADLTPNGFGLYDVTGNVLEWVHECSHENYDGAPIDGSVFAGGDCGFRTIRGGSYEDGNYQNRLSYKGNPATNIALPKIGVRCARDQCIPDCDGVECGDDGCGGTCGICAGVQDLCTGGVCVCQPLCDGMECGDDGCGGSCGDCTGFQEGCVDGACECIPACDGRACAADGCGGDCGTCGDGSACDDNYGLCVPEGEVLLPGDSFTMGASGDDGCPGLHNIPQHEVVISRPMVVMDHEITISEWIFASAQGAPAGDLTCTAADCPLAMVNWYELLHLANLMSQANGFETCYTLTDCSTDFGDGCPGAASCFGEDNTYTCTGVEFSGLDCSGYRLPTEAEWEYLARAGTGKAFGYPDGGTDKGDSCGPCSAEAILEEYAVYCNNSAGVAQSIRSEAANVWGLYDMAGNVEELVWDEWAVDYYAQLQGEDPLGPDAGAVSRATRGGTFDDAPAQLSAYVRSVAGATARRARRTPGPLRDHRVPRLLRRGGVR